MTTLPQTIRPTPYTPNARTTIGRKRQRIHALVRTWAPVRAPTATS